MKKREFKNPPTSSNYSPKRFTSETKENSELLNKKRKVQYENSLLGIIIFSPQ